MCSHIEQQSPGMSLSVIQRSFFRDHHLSQMRQNSKSGLLEALLYLRLILQHTDEVIVFTLKLLWQKFGAIKSLTDTHTHRSPGELLFTEPQPLHNAAFTLQIHLSV